MNYVKLTAKIKALYEAIVPTLTDGSLSELRVDKSGNLKVATGPCDSKVGITASAQLLAGPGTLYGFVIVSHTAGATVRFSDALTATTPYVSAAMTTVAGHIAGDYIPVGGPNGMKMLTGCYVTITGTIALIPIVKLD